MSKTILLADDSVTIQKVIELTFMDQGYEVISVSNGEEAIDKLAELTPDLIIADVHMPGADGYEVARKAKERNPAVPVLLLVGTFEPFDEAQAQASGADRHLKKPFDSPELLELVEGLTRSAPQAVPEPQSVFEPAPDPEPAHEPEPEEGFLSAGTDELGSFGGGETVQMETESFGVQDFDASPELDAEPSVELDSEPFGELELGAPEEAPSPVFGAGPAEPFAPKPSAPEEPAAPEPEPVSVPPDEPGESYALESEMLEGDPATAEYKLEDEPAGGEELAAAAEEHDGEISPAAAGVPPEAAPLGDSEPMASGQEPPSSVLESPAAAASGGDVPFPLSDHDVDRIARRVAELLGKEAVQEVAWEVVPDLAEIVIKDRIQELEAAVEQAE